MSNNMQGNVSFTDISCQLNWMILALRAYMQCLRLHVPNIGALLVIGTFAFDLLEDEASPSLPFMLLPFGKLIQSV